MRTMSWKKFVRCNDGFLTRLVMIRGLSGVIRFAVGFL